jgi:hypothetical protein
MRPFVKHGGPSHASLQISFTTRHGLLSVMWIFPAVVEVNQLSCGQAEEMQQRWRDNRSG